MARRYIFDGFCRAAMTREAKVIVLIHGQWLTPRSWEFFRESYEGQGYQVLAPAWPRMPGEVEETRRDPSPLAGLGLAEISDHYEGVVRSLNEPPILIGHSFGGLVVQMLLDRGLGAVGVAIDSIAPKGVCRLPLSTILAVNPMLSRPWNYRKTVGFTFDQFRYAFANSMPECEARSAFERYAIPGPGRTVFQAALANFNPWAASHVNYNNNSRAPLLLIAGGEDRLVPPVLTLTNFRQYTYSTALTDYKEFPHRSHLIVVQTGWKDVADYALSWTQAQMRRAAARDWQLGVTRSSPAL
jgi:pimeloyl-ACP methyl ester carboxylesterase